MAALAAAGGTALLAGASGVLEWQRARTPTELLRRNALEHPEDAALQRDLARRLLRDGAIGEALSAASAGVRADPRGAAGWVLYGEAALRSGRNWEAQRALSNAIEIDPSTADAYLLLGRSYTAQGSAHGAVDQLLRYTRLRPRAAAGWRELSAAFLVLDEPGNALNAARDGLRHWPSDPELLARAGEAIARHGRLTEAERMFRAALSRHPHHAASLAGLGRVILDRAREPAETAEAVRLLREAVAAAPGSYDARYDLGQALLTQGDAPGAIRTWQAILKEAPNEGRCHHALARALTGAGRTREARAHRAAFERLQRYRRELDALQLALLRAPDPGSVHFEIARLHLRYRRQDLARDALREVLSLRPGDDAARAALAGLGPAP